MKDDFDASDRPVQALRQDRQPPDPLTSNGSGAVRRQASPGRPPRNAAPSTSASRTYKIPTAE
ncbi:MAG: hypothetical protein MZU79_05975 [Anaerotruncus sp.]|nr:hypothetical protein [Anaerotruncus sp.]